MNFKQHLFYVLLFSALGLEAVYPETATTNSEVVSSKENSETTATVKKAKKQKQKKRKPKKASVPSHSQEPNESGVLIETEHPTTNKRTAVMDNEADSYWLFLAKNLGAEDAEVSTVFVATWSTPLDKPLSNEELLQILDTGGTPLFRKEYQTPFSVTEKLTAKDFSFQWSRDGQSILLRIKDNPHAMILNNKRYSKGISKEGFFGHPWDETIFEENFK